MVATTSSQAVQPTPGLLGLPRELRNEIYTYYRMLHVETNFDNYEYFNADELCLPINKIRPNNILHINTTLRQEYLAHFFAHEIFRMYSHIGQRRVGGLPNDMFCYGQVEYHWQQQRPYFPCFPCAYSLRTARWLDTLAAANGVQFRRVQFRLLPIHMIGETAPPHILRGASINVEYAPSPMSYEVEFRVDDGWSTPLNSKDGMLQSQTGGLRQAWTSAMRLVRRLRAMCRYGRADSFDWEVVKELDDALRWGHDETPKFERELLVFVGQHLEGWSSRDEVESFKVTVRVGGDSGMESLGGLDVDGP